MTYRALWIMVHIDLDDIKIKIQMSYALLIPQVLNSFNLVPLSRLCWSKILL